MIRSGATTRVMRRAQPHLLIMSYWSYALTIGEDIMERMSEVLCRTRLYLFICKLQCGVIRIWK